MLSLARDPRLRCHSHIDERCAGFFAVGLAKSSGLPVAVTCTSGTAVAELLPAAIEAHEARVPLLVLSADRPPELRESGAGQTIDQLGLFGSAAKWFFEVGTHELTGGDARLRWMRTLACRAYWRALEGRPGVVHLNFALREPLVVDGDALPDDPTGRPEGAPYVRRTPARAPGSSAVADGGVVDPPLAESLAANRMVSSAALDALRAVVRGARRGVVVAGRHERPAPLGDAADAFCRAFGWPLLADPLSGARRGECAVAHYDALLRDGTFAAAVRPDVVIRVGDLPTSKPLRLWLAGLGDTPQVQIDPEGAWQDPAGVLSHSLALEPANALAGLAREATDDARPAGGAPPEARTVRTGDATCGDAALAPADPDWLALWRSADERAAEAILGVLAAGGLSEPTVAAELGVLLPARATLFVASSMPIRDVETFWPVRPDPPRVLCNRGANGIDGTVSSAFGVAADCARDAHPRPVVLLIGDVALAHDIGGLIAARRLDLPVTIVLLDNGGGGIFDFLPASAAPMARAAPAAAQDPAPPAADDPAPSAEDIYTRHIATPTGLDFADAARLYGLAHERVGDVASLRAALERALTARPPRASIVEVRGERHANVALHRRVWEAVSGALGAGA